MADDDNLISATTRVDTSGLEAGGQQAIAITRAQLAVMQEQYRAYSSEIKKTVQQIVESERNAANATITAQEAAADGLEDVVAEQQSIASRYQANADIQRGALEGVISKQTELAASMATAKNATEQSAGAFAFSKEQLGAMDAATQIASRQVQTLGAIQKEVANSIGASSAQMQTLYVRALTEMRLASAALAKAQDLLAPAAAAGTEQAVAAITSLEESYVSAAAVVAELKSQIAALTESEAAAAAVTQSLVDPTEALAAATAQAAKQAQILASIERDVANSVGATASELQSVYIRAASEAKTAANALVQAQRSIGPAAAHGSAEAAAALKTLESSHQATSAAATELKARITLLSQAEAKATEETLVEARAQVQAAIAREGSAVAALRAANALDQSSTTSRKQLEAIASASEIAARQVQTLGDIQQEAATKIGISSTEMQALYVRAVTEMRVASSALAEAQRVLAPTTGAGGAEAAQAISSLERSYAAAATVVSNLKTQIIALSESESAQAATTATLLAPTEALDAALTLAANQSRSLAAIQSEVATSVGATSTQLQSVYIRAATEAKTASNALAQAEKTIGTAAAAGSEQAVAALQTLQANHQAAVAVAAELQARITLLARAEAESTVDTVAQARAQVEATIATEGSAVAALRLADATDASTASSKRQLEAIASASEIAARQIKTLGAIQQEVANSFGASSAQMQAVYVRATTEMRIASSALAEAQSALAPAAAAGAQEAIDSISSLEDSYVAAAAVVTDLKAQIDALAETEASAGAATASVVRPTEALAAATALAETQSKNLAAIQTEVNAKIGASSAELRSVYVRAATEARTASNALAQAQRQMGTAAAQGTAEAAATLKILQANHQATSASAAELQARITLLSNAEDNATAATVAEARAQIEAAIAKAGSAEQALRLANAEEQLAGASAHAASEVQSVSAAVRVADGALPIRAVERFTVSVLGLGPAFQAIFPIIGAIAFGEVLVHIAEEAYKVYENFVNLKDAEQEVLKLSESLGKEFDHAYERMVHYQAEALKRSGKLVEAAQLEMQNAASVPIEFPKIDDKKLKELNGDQLKSLKDAFSEVIPAELPARIDLIKQKLAELDAQDKKRQQTAEEQQKLMEQGVPDVNIDIGTVLAEEHAESVTRVQRELYSGLLQTLQQYQATYGAEQQDFSAKVDQARQEEIRKAQEAANKLKAAYRQKEEDLRHSDQITLEDMELAGTVTFQQREALFQKELIAEAKYVDRVREIRQQLVQVQRQAARALEEANKQVEEDLIKASELEQKKAGATAPEGGAKRAELTDLEQQLTKARGFPDLYKSISDRIVEITKSAGEEADKAVKQTVDEQYEIWTTGGNRSLQAIIYFWTTAKSTFFTNSELVKEANAKIAESTAKLREETEKLNDALAKQKEIAGTGVLEERKLDIQRQTIIHPQGSLNPLALTPEQEEKQKIGQIELDEIDLKRKAAAKEVEDAKAAGKEGLAAYEDLKNKQAQIDEQYELKRRQLDNQALADELGNYRKFIQQIDQVVLSGFNEWILGQKRFGQAMVDVWKGIVGEIIKDLEKVAVKIIEEEVILAGLRKLLAAIGLGTPAGQTQGRGQGQPAGQLPGQGGGGTSSPLSAIPVLGGILGKIFGPGAGPAGVPGGGGVLGTGVGAPGSGPSAPGLPAPAPLGNIGARGTGQVVDRTSEQLNVVLIQLLQVERQSLEIQRELLTTERQLLTVERQLVTHTQQTASNLQPNTKAVSDEAQVAAIANQFISLNTRTMATNTVSLQASTQAAQSLSTELFVNSLSVLGNTIAHVINTIALAYNTTALWANAAKPVATGGFIPTGGLFQLHPGEVVVNHPVTSLLSNIAARGNAYHDIPRQVAPAANPALFQPKAGPAANAAPTIINEGAQGDSHYHAHMSYAPTIHGGGNTEDLKAMLTQHADHLGRIMQKQLRTFNR